MLRLFLSAALLATPAITVAQDSPQRIRNVQIQRGQPCPKSTPDEVVVCSTLEEPYRIPKGLRDDGEVAPAQQSWVNQAAALDETSRVAGGLPDTCSTVGTGGQTGCFQARAKAYAAEKRAGNVAGR